jgi:hypothetical protein
VAIVGVRSKMTSERRFAAMRRFRHCLGVRLRHVDHFDVKSHAPASMLCRSLAIVALLSASALVERFQSSNHMGCPKWPHSVDGKPKVQLSGFMESVVYSSRLLKNAIYATALM